ncbi:MAG: ABC transporter ATP-binding protein [Firmicutes bacterium]|uniref:ABC transporter ATP-binding protein n=1 Tax=Geochorda subterranea TaxID=3109564 RepID=A0ABZ1BSM2_9FIRM|nr:ABC transporter ATP-binding protein [Limnochorda sp. LNt]NLG69811.1 ABC transporter ATP-binding protein [Bacillota bacterium]WRP15526.1 ABC transporter ATP-binding protein [Limnochorda sp. LNt]
MLAIRGLVKRYGRSPVPAVDGLDLEVGAGEIFGFLGPNGAGKTTTIKVVVGILRPDAGQVTIDGRPAVPSTPEVRRLIGYVPDTPELWPRLRGSEYLAFLADVYQIPPEERMDRAWPLVEALELVDAIDSLISSYSHGMRQKLALVGALMVRPHLLVLDEPLVGLDPRSSYVVKELLREHTRRGGTVFFSTHILDVAERLCDRVGIIHKGRLVASGTLDEMRALHARGHETLEAIFLEVTRASLTVPEGSDGRR